MALVPGSVLMHAAPADSAAAERAFTLKVLPLLKAKCFACHGENPDKIKGELSLLTREGLLKGGASSDKVLVPGDARASQLLVAVTWENPDLEMPPKENDRLTQEQVELVRAWIDAGAPWPEESEQKKHRDEERTVISTAAGVIMKSSGGLDDEWTHRRYKPEDVWAFQPVKMPAVPVMSSAAKLESKTENPLDAFINARLAQAGIVAAARAEARALLRRICFDLTGLPPTPEQVERWSSRLAVSGRGETVAELVNELLSSPHYGERWAQHWLDVVRYADTSGFSNDYERANAWRYRDYVIRSFNTDKPYDRFILEQIAGDELEPENPEMMVATGFLRMGPWEHTPMNPDVVSRQAYLDDVVNIVGQTFFSTPMRCCKCHDHKFDPLPTRDYYRLYAAFSATQPVERPAEFLSEENRSAFEQNRQQVKTLLAFAQGELDKIYAKREEAARKWYAERNRPYVDEPTRRNQPDDDKPPRHFGLSTADEGEMKVREQDVRIWKRAFERYEPLAQAVCNGGNLHQQSDRLRMPDPNKKGELARAAEIARVHILAGGSIEAKTLEVTPGVLSAVGLPAATGTAADPWALPDGVGGRRLELAKWIANPANPLTTRSIVNRVWGWHFGQALAGNPNNFGQTGKKPTHPELLDWLAASFVQSGWSLKHLHRLIMTSEAYQRSCDHTDLKAVREKDPNNHLLAVFSPRRLAAEELRDAMLTITGELNRELGGLPIRPAINLEVALAPRMIQFSIAPGYQPSRTPAERNRRSIYAQRIRGLADPLMEVFNKPGSENSCEKRDASNVTPQVFSMMNSDVMTSRSIALALRLEKEAETPELRIARALEFAFGRTPRAAEAKVLLEHFREMTEYHREHQPEPVQYPVQVTRSLVEEFSGEAFEYQELLDVYRHYVPDPQAAAVSAQTRALADICLLLFNANEFVYVY